MNTRTYNAKDWLAALDEWEAGKFGPEWRDFRHQAAMKGMIYPPTGSRHDSWDDPEPSQRALVYRAVTETPRLLRAAIDRSKSWGEVLTYVLARRDEWARDLDQKERVLARQRADEQNPREAMMSLRAIMDRIGES